VTAEPAVAYTVRGPLAELTLAPYPGADPRAGGRVLGVRFPHPLDSHSRPRFPEGEARQALARGRVVLVVSSGDTPVCSYDPTQPESRAARLAVEPRSSARQGARTPSLPARRSYTTLDMLQL
jgi:hypothetical protein